MGSPEIQLERRAAQRFGINLPVRIQKGDLQAQGFSQDLSLRGMFFYTEMPIEQGDILQIALMMPAEATLSDPMPVRCRGSVLRVVPHPGGSRYGAAVRLTGHEYSEEAARQQFAAAPLSSTEPARTGFHGAD